MFYTAGMCGVMYIGVYNTYLHGKYFLSAQYNDITSDASPHSKLLIVNSDSSPHVYLKAVHAQTITFPAEIQCGPCIKYCYSLDQ